MENLTEKEMQDICGGEGVTLIRIEGLFDGEKGNEHLYILGIRIF